MRTPFEYLIMLYLISQIAFGLMGLSVGDLSGDSVNNILYIVILIGMVLLIHVCLLIGLIRPTTRLLIAGTIFFGLGIFDIEYFGNSWSWGFSVGFSLTYGSYLISDILKIRIELINVFACLLFLAAYLYRRFYFRPEKHYA